MAKRRKKVKHRVTKRGVIAFNTIFSAEVRSWEERKRNILAKS